MAQLGETILAFARDGHFPSDADSAIVMLPENIGPAIEVLKNAKKSLEAEIHTINEETRDDIGSWLRNAKSLQEDILRSKAMANEITREAEDPGSAGRAVEEAETKATFLTLEVQYAQQLHAVLRAIKHVHGLLNEVQQLVQKRHIADALRVLDDAVQAIQQIPVNWLCRPKRVLEVRAQELRTEIHAVLERVWADLVVADVGSNKFCIQKSVDDGQITFQDTVLALKQYKEVDEYMEQLWHNLDNAIISPRMELDQWTFSSVEVQGDTLVLSGETDNTVCSLLSDLGKVFAFLGQNLPPDVLDTLCAKVMDDFTTKLISTWLNDAVPPSIHEIDQLDEVVHHTKIFCEVLQTNNFSGFDALVKWVSNTAVVWLDKCRESTLDMVRTKLATGLGVSKQVELVKTEVIPADPEPEEEQKEDAGWDSAWVDDESAEKEPKADDEDDGADAWGWNDDGAEDTQEKEDKKDDADDAADAWGWGDEDAAEAPAPALAENKPKTKASAPEKKTAKKPVEVVTREKCAISSMPEPVLKLVYSILEDAAAVAEFDDENLIAPAAAGLFKIPTLALELFRAISPYYYSLADGGNMFLYNDAMYVAQQLSDFSSAWKDRSDVGVVAKAMLKLDDEVDSLKTFATRAFNNELATQQTIVGDLLGGAYNLIQHGDSEASIEATVARVQTVADEWQAILSQSAWCRALGSLVESIARKIIGDIMGLASIGQEEAYQMASMIMQIGELDKLFLPSRLAGSFGLGTGAGSGAGSGSGSGSGSSSSAPPKPDGEEISRIAGFVPSWLRMQFLSEVLQSNLNEIKYLWFESDLSMYFSAEEVVDLIGASFEMNARAKEVVREIEQQPRPRA
ncbi:hypothetical protein TD95_003426 [Thielaviopsis punctulata]|uniref:ZW10 C-terminal helical domain-containing protein n=1 Tax=Thielaviopsis punctulata TaxID=72032 RepID=A0A0F4Z918_9PEZI|nr:hypothetical protein TD95_003426 [Thielaviopsis punctulata]